MLEQPPRTSDLSVRLEPSPKKSVRSVGFLLLGMGLGVLLGGGLASAIWFSILASERAAYEQTLVAHGLSLIGGQGGEGKGDIAAVKKVGDDFVEDLHQNRLLAAYRAMTENYQRNVSRDKFDAMVRKVPEMAQWRGTPQEPKVRKGAGGGKVYEYYSTTTHINNTNSNEQKRINVALTLLPEGGTWKVMDLEIQADERK